MTLRALKTEKSLLPKQARDSSHPEQLTPLVDQSYRTAYCKRQKELLLPLRFLGSPTLIKIIKTKNYKLCFNRG